MKALNRAQGFRSDAEENPGAVTLLDFFHLGRQLSSTIWITFRQSGPSSAASSFSNDLKYRFRCPDSPPNQIGISFVISLRRETLPHQGDCFLFTCRFPSLQPIPSAMGDGLAAWKWCGEESLRSSIPLLIGKRPSGPRLPSTDPLGLQVQDAPAT